MEKFTLNEAFDKLYEMALEEQLQEDIDNLLEEQENQAQFIDALKILDESVFFEVLTTGSKDGEEDEKEKEKKGSEKKDKDDDHVNKWGDIMNFYDKMSSEIDKRAQAQYDAKTKAIAAQVEPVYKPEVQFTRVERLSDMKFPQNIIFFITQLLKWIKNNILNFIDKFSNIVRSLLGMEAGKGRFTKEDLKLRLSKAKDVETKYLLTGADAYKNVTSFEDKLNRNFSGDYDDMTVNKTKTVTLYDIPADQVKSFLAEDYSLINIFNEGYDDDDHASTRGKMVEKAICLDTSKDLFALQQSLDHFYGLFDQAYGSNDERLFSIDDLEIMLQLFKQTYDSIFSGQAKALEIAGELSFDSGIDANRLKDNLLRTKINTDNLKKAYVITNKQINNISQIIMNKNLLGASQMGVSFAFLSASTYEIMIEILTTIDARLKEAKLMEKKLQKMKKSYENLVNVLEQRRAKINAISGITMTTILQRKINELYDGARYMTQTVQLRMSTLALYISELNDTRVILRNLNAIPEASLKSNKGILGKFKSLSIR